jgi:hypothetical protein
MDPRHGWFILEGVEMGIVARGCYAEGDVLWE